MSKAGSRTTAGSGEGIARIALVKTRDRVKGMRRAIALATFESVQGKQVLLKPNLNGADPPPGSTHPDVLRALVRELQERGAQSITVADRSGGGDTRSVMQKLGVFDMAEELGFDAVVLDELPAEEWVMVQPEGSHWRRGFPFARLIREAEAVVQTCCVKTHRFGGHFTMSLKNSVGMVGKRVPGHRWDYMYELHVSRRQREMIAEINTAYVPNLVVLDAVEAFVRGGPAKGHRARTEVMLAGTDRVALDAVGVALLRMQGTTRNVARGPIFAQPQLARAVELGLGVGDPELIEFVTDDPDSEAYAGRIREVLLQG